MNKRSKNEMRNKCERKREPMMIGVCMSSRQMQLGTLHIAAGLLLLLCCCCSLSLSLRCHLRWFIWCENHEKCLLCKKPTLSATLNFSYDFGLVLFSFVRSFIHSLFCSFARLFICTFFHLVWCILISIWVDRFKMSGATFLVGFSFLPCAFHLPPWFCIQQIIKNHEHKRSKTVKEQVFQQSTVANECISGEEVCLLQIFLSSILKDALQIVQCCFTA